MRYEVKTKLSPEQALLRAIDYFGPKGTGLALTSQDKTCLVFQGGGGHIAVSLQAGASTTLELETREWDYAVQHFMAQLH